MAIEPPDFLSRPTSPWKPPVEAPNGAQNLAPQRPDTTVDKPVSRPNPVDVRAAVLDEAGDAERYTTRTLLGEGGMGEVQLCRDERIGRDVAMKRIKPAMAEQGDIQRRFVREARVQGQLEHPAVVPVYDLGVGEDGAAWFTMKRVRGRTLAEILDGLADAGAPGNAATPGTPANAGVERGQRFSRRRLLSAFSSLCLAVDFAHTRGVLHRDLKPGNVMLGDFGEVYLLDWGLAKLFTEPDADPVQSAAASMKAPPAAVDDLTRREIALPPRGYTEESSVMGTPGYMAPEQVRGHEVGPATDVYSLGVMLFELLAGQPLHREPDAVKVFAATLAGVDARPSARAPDRDLPPELDAICARATALLPTDRYPSARALQEEIERFLDGDRDLERRRQLAAEHTAAAEAAAARAVAATTPKDEERERALAMRESSRALALDPHSAGAVRTMARLMMRPPSVLPPAAQADVDRAGDAQRQIAGNSGALIYLSWILFAPWLFWLGLRSVTDALVPLTLMTSAGLLAALGARKDGKNRRLQGAVLVLSSLGIASASRSFGPFIIVPSIAAANTLGFLLTQERRLRPLILACGALTFLVPLALECLGVLPRSYRFEHDTMVIVPHMHDLPEVASLVFLAVGHVAILVNSSLFMMRVRTSLTEAERRLHLYAWHLSRLVPEDALDGMEPAAAPAAPTAECRIETSGIRRLFR